MTIHVIARWRANIQTLAEVLGYVADLRRQSLAEPGCVGYEVFREIENAASLLLLERYTDNAALEAHRNSSHYRELVAGHIIPLLDSRQVEIVQGIPHANQ